MISIQEIRDSNYDSRKIEIKKYLALDDKDRLINSIVLLSLYEENGIKRVSYIKKMFAIEYFLIKYYTDIDFDEISEIKEIYDELKVHGLIEKIYREMNDDERNSIINMVNNELEQIIKEQDSVGLQIKAALEKIIDKIPDEKQMSKLIKSLPNMINKIDKDKVATLKDVFDINKVVK